jgi:hypothetical protein
VTLLRGKGIGISSSPHTAFGIGLLEGAVAQAGDLLVFQGFQASVNADFSSSGWVHPTIVGGGAANPYRPSNNTRTLEVLVKKAVGGETSGSFASDVTGSRMYGVMWVIPEVDADGIIAGTVPLDWFIQNSNTGVTARTVTFDPAGSGLVSLLAIAAIYQDYGAVDTTFGDGDGWTSGWTDHMAEATRHISTAYREITNPGSTTVEFRWLSPQAAILGVLGIPHTATNVKPDADLTAPAEVNPGQSFTLDATSSTDSDGTIKSYAFAQTAGPTVSLSGTGGTRTTAAPANGGVTLTFRVTVTDDDNATDTATFSVYVNAAPTVTAPADKFAVIGETVALTAVGADSDGTIASYEWTGPPGLTIDDDDLATCSIDTTGAPAGSHLLTVRSRDNDGVYSAPDTVVLLLAEPPNPEGGWTLVSGTFSADQACTIEVLVRVLGVDEDEIHYLETSSVSRGQSTVWTRGGLEEVFFIERSVDGGPWEPVRNGTHVLGDESGTLSVEDREFPSGSTVRYRARSQAEV